MGENIAHPATLVMALDMSEPSLRVFYAAGPGDIIGTYRYWKQNQADPSIPGLTDSGQFYDWVRESGQIKAMAISSCPRKDYLEEDPFTLQHIPKKEGSGAGYHLSQILYGLRICYKAICFKADLAIIEEGTSDWFVWNLLHFFGIKIIPSLKCVLWAEFKPLSFKQKILNAANRSFFRKKVLAVLSMSPLIDKQVAALAEPAPPPIFNFLPMYKKDVFSDIPPPDFSQRPFIVLFIGRIEPFKGVFDLIEIAKNFKKNNLTDIYFEFCGQGSASEALKQKILSEQLSETCHVHGYCDRDQLRAKLAASHAVIAPSRTSFGEGFCMVVVEGVLAGRPVVTSKVCPSLYTIQPAACEAQPDDVASYEEAILKLYHSPSYYKEKQEACSTMVEPFYDMENSWQAALKKAISLTRH